MKPAKTTLESLDYLLGGVSLLALATVMVPSVLVAPTLATKAVLFAMLLLACYALWWALHRFTELAERVVAVV